VLPRVAVDIEHYGRIFRTLVEKYSGNAAASTSRISFMTKNLDSFNHRRGKFRARTTR